MKLLSLYRQLNVGNIITITNRKYYTSTRYHYNPNNNVIPISKKVVKLNPILNSTLKGRHLVSLAGTLCKNYKSFIAHRDEDIVSRFWFIIITKLIDLIDEKVEDCIIYSWKDRIPRCGSISENDNRQINVFEVVKLFKYFSLIRLLDNESPVSRLLCNIQWATHLLNSKSQNKITQNNTVTNINNAPFFSRIFTPTPNEINYTVGTDSTSCNLSNSPTHLVRYEWILDQSYNFGIPNEYSDHIKSISDFITALKATLIINIKDYILLNYDTNCYAKLLMYIAMITPNDPISPPYFNEIINANLNQIKTHLSEHLCTNINLLDPRLIAFIANASGIGGNYAILDKLEEYLIGDDGLPTELAMSLHPDHLENICYAFSRQRIVKRRIFKTLSTIIKYKFDDFSPVVTLNLLFSYTRVNHEDMVSKYLISKINNYTMEQLSDVSEKVLANAMQALANFYNNHDIFIKLVQVIISKRSKSDRFDNDLIIYNNVIKRLIERGVMNEPLDKCTLYNELIKLVNPTL